MTTSRDDLARALVDVRKAYRLLHGYHRRLNDLLQRVEETVGKRGLVFERWAPANVDPLPGPKKAFFAPGKWAWDLTPAYQVACAWSSAPTSGKVRRIGLVAVADTGYSVRGDGEPNPVRFTNATDSATEIWIAGWTADFGTPNWSKAWEAVQRIPNSYEGETHEVVLDAVRYSYRYLKTVNVADLISPDAVDEHILAPIEAWLGTPDARQQVR